MSVLLNCLITRSHYLTTTENGCCKFFLPAACTEKQRKAGGLNTRVQEGLAVGVYTCDLSTPEAEAGDLVLKPA